LVLNFHVATKACQYDVSKYSSQTQLFLYFPGAAMGGALAMTAWEN